MNTKTLRRLRAKEKLLLDDANYEGFFRVILRQNMEGLNYFFHTGVDLNFLLKGENVFKLAHSTGNQELLQKLIARSVFLNWAKEEKNRVLLEKKAQLGELEFALRSEETLLLLQKDFLEEAMAGKKNVSWLKARYQNGLQNGEGIKIIGFEREKGVLGNLVDNYENWMDGCAERFFLWFEEEKKLVHPGIKGSHTRERLLEKKKNQIQRNIEKISSPILSLQTEADYPQALENINVRLDALQKNVAAFLEEEAVCDKKFECVSAPLQQMQKVISVLLCRLAGYSLPLVCRQQEEVDIIMDDALFAKIFLEHLRYLNIPLTSTDHDNFGILDYAGYYRNLILVKFCLENGLDPLRYNRFYQTVIDHAILKPYYDLNDPILSLLREYLLSQKIFEKHNAKEKNQRQTELFLALEEANLQKTSEVPSHVKAKLAELLSGNAGHLPYEYFFFKAEKPLKNYLAKQFIHGNLAAAVKLDLLQDVVGYLTPEEKRIFLRALRVIDEDTLLHIALEKNQLKNAKVLLEYVEPWLRNRKKLNAFDIALQHGKDSAAVKLLEKKLQEIILNSLPKSELPKNTQEELREKLRDKLRQTAEFPIHFSGHALSGEQFVQLCKTLEGVFISELNLSFTRPFQKTELNALNELLKSPAVIKKLNLSGVCLNDAGLKYLFPALKAKENTIKQLDLSNNFLTEAVRSDLEKLSEKIYICVDGRTMSLGKEMVLVEQKLPVVDDFSALKKIVEAMLNRIPKFPGKKNVIDHAVDALMMLPSQLIEICNRYSGTYCCYTNNFKSQSLGQLPADLRELLDKKKGAVSESGIKQTLFFYLLNKFKGEVDSLFKMKHYDVLGNTELVQMLKQLVEINVQVVHDKEKMSQTPFSFFGPHEKGNFHPPNKGQLPTYIKPLA